MAIGFTIIKHSINSATPAIKCQKHISSLAASAQYDFFHNTNTKFQEDKLFVENEQYIYGLDGPILNLQELKNNFAIPSWPDLFLTLYKKYKTNLPGQLKGDFSGFVFEKKTEKLLVFNNDVGTRRIYYGQSGSTLVIVPSLIQWTDYFNEKEQPPRLNRFAAYNMLTYGAMAGNQTYMDQVHRLLAGESLVFESNQLQVHKYIDYNDIVFSNKSEATLLGEINEHFVRALRQEMDKDKEYNYQSIGTLSGGLDSRMTIMLAHKMGYKIKPFCFSQSNYYDEKIAREIAESMGEDLQFFALDEAKHLFDLEDNLEAYDALSFYTSSAHFAWGLKQMDFTNTGLIHTGMIGDGVFGSCLTSPENLGPNVAAKLISNKLFPKIEKEMNAFAKEYANEESYALYNRMFNLSVTGTYICAPYGYHSTPFMDGELIKLLFSIPPKMKYYQKMYLKWINEFHPEVTKFTWERTRMKPTAHWKTKLSLYTLKLEQLYRRYTGTAHLLTMTPYALWNKQYPEIEHFFRAEYEKRKHLIAEDQELSKDVSLLFESGNPVERSMVLTLLGAVERYKLKV
ncbi:MAG: asparagine synthase (glutamine-hydrolyzing) [Nonlabens sp.]|jgi:asparagine synthase (glutamine-hydrolysing)